MTFVLADAVLNQMTSDVISQQLHGEQIGLPESWFTTIHGRRLTSGEDKIKLQFSG